MADLKNGISPVMEKLLQKQNNGMLTEAETKEVRWLMSLNIKEQSNITLKTFVGFRAAVELYEANAKIDLITYKRKKVRMDGGHNEHTFQYNRLEEKPYKIMISREWCYLSMELDEYIEESESEYYSLAFWRKLTN